jgi:hypothetical protein
LCHCCCLHPDSGRHSCCCWRSLSSWWFPVAGLSAIAEVPGKAKFIPEFTPFSTVWHHQHQSSSQHVFSFGQIYLLTFAYDIIFCPLQPFQEALAKGNELIKG